MKLWYHESCRVFQDRLVNDEDRSWFDNLMKSKMKSEFNIEFDDVVKQQPLIFGDFMSQGGDQKPYVEITDHEKVFVGRKKSTTTYKIGVALCSCQKICINMNIWMIEIVKY